MILVFTAKGRNARLFCWSRTCNKRVNDQIVDRMMEPQAETSQTLAWRRRLWWAQLRSSTGADQAPNELALKTKVFQAARKESNGDEEQTCAICFNPLQGGERVGALPCKHEFHVECLKGWLTRRNACPLCQAPDVASPRYRVPNDSQGI